MANVKDNFENGYLWEIYRDLENQFLTFLDYVPYLKGNENTYSFRLFNLIVSIGGYVDSALKEMVRYRNLPNNRSIISIRAKLQRWEAAFVSGKKMKPADYVYINDTLSILEKEYSLSKKFVVCKIISERAPLPPQHQCCNNRYV